MIDMQDHRETADCYRYELVRQGRFRIVLCKDGIQWIVQRQKRGAAARWQAVGYCTTREALIRLWTGLNRDIPPELTVLPDTARGGRNG